MADGNTQNEHPTAEKDRVELGLAIAGLIFEYGIPATVNILQTLDQKAVTAQDIHELKHMVPPPESYLPEEAPR